MQLNSSIVVPQDIRHVWRFLGDPLTAPLWDRSIAEVIPLSTAPVGVGYEAMTVGPSGKRQRFRITQYDAERELAFVLLESRLFRRAELAFQLDRVADGTQILHRIDLDLRSPLLAPVLRLMSPNALGTDMEYLREALAKDAHD
ncbi:SRPBCC family protein [Nonomuraea sp. NPDC005650]|uniref:SRPBCC family protein n=1 Tax=Nonomuraea sp. NPDC005650 TaxID=3157045 RepID=UPI0033B3E252